MQRPHTHIIFSDYSRESKQPATMDTILAQLNSMPLPPEYGHKSIQMQCSRRLKDATTHTEVIKIINELVSTNRLFPNEFVSSLIIPPQIKKFKKYTGCCQIL